MTYLQTPYERIPQIWISDETPTRVLFVKGRSGVDPDVLVAYAENDSSPLWIVDDGATKYDKPSYFVCAKGGKSFNARPVLNDPVSAMMASALSRPLSQTPEAK